MIAKGNSLDLAGKCLKKWEVYEKLCQNIKVQY